MGSKIIKWCDACNKDVTHGLNLTEFRYGTQPEFKGHSNGNVTAANKADICDECLAKIQVLIHDFLYQTKTK